MGLFYLHYDAKHLFPMNGLSLFKLNNCGYAFKPQRFHQIIKQKKNIFSLQSLYLYLGTDSLPGLDGVSQWPQPSDITPPPTPLSLNGYNRRVVSPWEVSPALLSFKATPTLLQTLFPPGL